MKLTIGMAHANDFDGVAFSIQSLRMHHEEGLDIEYIVIDNTPNTPHGKEVARLCAGMGVKYIPFTGSSGTTQTRQAIFDNATGDAVLCMDCHVLFSAGAIKALVEYYKSNPDTKDLYSGPILMDGLKSYSTHFDLLWRSQMWGIWAYASKCRECGLKFSFQPARDFKNHKEDLYLTLDTEQIDCRGQCPKCKKSLKDSVYNKVDVNKEIEPFQIPAQGLGVFTCMRHAWLGFNKNFKGFGGEEGYIHYKFKNAGHKTYCLPWLKWWHRFARPAGAPYVADLYDKLNNYIYGFSEIGRPLEEIRDHFILEGKIKDNNEWIEVLQRTFSGGSKSCAKNTCGKKLADKPVEQDKKADGPENVKKITGSTAKEIYPQIQSEESERFRKYMDKSESLMCYAVDAKYIFAAMTTDNIKSMILCHSDSKQAEVLGKYAPSTMTMKLVSDEYKPDTNIDMMIVGFAKSKDHFEEIMQNANKCNKYVVLPHSLGNIEAVNSINKFIANNIEWFVQEIGANEQVVLLSRVASEKPAQPIYLNNPGYGAGTELKKFLSRLGINSTPTCSCNHKANMMDIMGIDWCAGNVDKIVGWLEEEATKRKIPVFSKMVARVVVNKAIKKARKTLATKPLS
jgi:glycosyltransferase involved in cell wall biosynthesis